MINLEKNITKFFDRKLEIEEILSKSNLDPKEFATLSKELSDVTQVTDLSLLINSKNVYLLSRRFFLIFLQDLMNMLKVKHYL